MNLVSLLFVSSFQNGTHMLEFIVTCGLTFYSLVKVEVLLCGCLHSLPR